MKKISISKSANHALLVDEDELQSLCDYLATKYDKLKLIASCVDGTTLEASAAEDILQFDNPTARKITDLTVDASNSFEDRVSVDINGGNLLGGGSFTIKSLKDEDALIISTEILSRFEEMKPWYDILARYKITYFLLGVLIFALIGSSIGAEFGLIPKSSSQNTPEQWVIGFVIAFILISIGIWINAFQRYLFPRVFFLIGKQKRTMERVIAVRKYVFSGVILAIVVGIIANILSSFVTR
jgi:hypothetical protein